MLEVCVTVIVYAADWVMAVKPSTRANSLPLIQAAIKVCSPNKEKDKYKDTGQAPQTTTHYDTTTITMCQYTTQTSMSITTITLTSSSISSNCYPNNPQSSPSSTTREMRLYTALIVMRKNAQSSQYTPKLPKACACLQQKHPPYSKNNNHTDLVSILRLVHSGILIWWSSRLLWYPGSRPVVGTWLSGE